mgnify:CR=1 FL=1
MNKLLVDGIYAANIVKLKDIAEKRTTKNIDGLVTETFTNSAENGIISQSDFFDRTITNDKNISGYYIVEPDDFVYNPRISTFAPVGPINRNKLGRSGVMSPLYLVFHTHDVEPEYLEWYFKSNVWHQFMRDNGNTGARSDRFSISDAEFFNMPIPIPPVKVQKAIAKTLTTLDTKVTLEKNEVEKFQNLKSAMLTKMFPKKGENVPEIRFDGFTDAWEQHKLIDVCDYVDYRGKTPTKTDSGNFLVTAKNIKDGYIDYETSQEYISEDDYEETMHRGKPEIGDVLITTEAPCGNVAQVNKENIALAQRIIKYRGHRNLIANTYLKYYLLSPEFQNILNAKSSGGTVKGIKGSILHQQIIKYPKYEEQVKIGQDLNAINNLITLHQRKYEKLIDTKKAFLEKLIGGEK